MRVLFVFSDRSCPCTLKRTFEVLCALHEYKRDEIEANAILYRRLSKKEFTYYDIILFQRLGANDGVITSHYRKKLFDWMDAYRAKTTYIYDIDDLLLETQDGFPVALMQHCHWALAPNSFLAAQLKQFQPRCHIIPTHIDLRAMEEAPTTALAPHLTHIGWFSNGAEGIEIIQSIYPELCQRYRNKIQIHTYVAPRWIPDIEQRFSQGLIQIYPIVSLREMYSLVKGMDILINPLNDNKTPFLNSKSEIKYLHAGAAKKPLVVTPIVAYRDAITHGITGFLTETAEEWLNTLSELIDRPELREEIGRNAYSHICDNYTYAHVADRYAQFFKRLVYPNATLPSHV